MTTRLERFKRQMEPAKELYTKEISNFAKNFDALGEMSVKERPDIDTLDYIYSFEKLNGTSAEELDLIHSELYDHMKKFSKENGIHEFYMNTVIHL